jgi:hypothetical protein
MWPGLVSINFLLEELKMFFIMGQKGSDQVAIPSLGTLQL